MNSIPNLPLFLSTVFLGFFAMLNPIGNTPVFLTMVGNADKKTIKRVALRAVVVAFIIIAIFSRKNNIQLFAGQRRGGPACSAGVCYEVLDFSGVELRINTRF